jgi:hypothetical protein
MLSAGLVLVLGGVALAYLFLNDAWLGGFITKRVQTLGWRGKLEIASVHWSARGLRLTGVRITDPGGKEAAWIPSATCQLDLLPLVSNTISIRELRTSSGTRVLYDTDPQQGFVATFRTRGHAGSRSSGPGGRFRLDAQLDDVDIRVKIGRTLDIWVPHARTPLDLDVRETGTLLAIAPHGGAGLVHLLGAELPLGRLDVAQFGSTAQRANDLTFDISAELAGAGVHVGGGLDGAFAPTLDTTFDMTIDVDHGGRAVSGLMAKLVASPTFGGESLSGSLHLGGPTDYPLLTADVRDVELADPAQIPTPVIIKRGHATFDTGRNRLTASGVTARALGGEVAIPRAFIDLTAQTADASLGVTGVDISPFVPPKQRALAGGYLSGKALIAGPLRGPR